MFPQIFDFILFGPPKRCLIISHSQKIFQICFTISVESSITFPNLVQASSDFSASSKRYGAVMKNRKPEKMKHIHLTYTYTAVPFFNSHRAFDVPD